MAPNIAVPADLAERFPDLAAQLQPRAFTGEVVVVGDVLTQSDYDKIDAWEQEPLRESGFMMPDGSGGVVETHRPDFKSRADSPPVIPTPGPGADWIEQIVTRVVWHFGIIYPPVDRALLGHYGPGDHFAWHRDDMLPATANRETAIVVGLNDNYEGGLLELPEAGMTIKVKRGMGVAFPASALHRVTPVTSGVRKVLLTFVLKDVPT